MIKMIAGTFGYRNPATGRVEAKTPASEPFEIPSNTDGRTEKELVELGVAEYVKCEKEVAPVQLSEKDTAEETETPPQPVNKKKAKKAQDEVKADETEAGPELDAELPE